MTATLDQSTTISGPSGAGPDHVPPQPPAGIRGRARRLWRGPDGDPPWVRRAFLGLLAATAVLYLWNLSTSGWANAFYSAAVQAGASSWKAFFFGSSDASNFITVDKPPASLWLMDLSARLFGVNSFAILLPQALEGVAAVGVLYAAVRRTSGYAAGLIAGAVLALTPVAALMFRFNNPDALLTLLMTIAAYCVIRALTAPAPTLTPIPTSTSPLPSPPPPSPSTHHRIRRPRLTTASSTTWLALAGACIGFAFLTKTLQAFLVLPAFALVYLIAAPTPLRRRVKQLAIATAAMVVAGGWWVAIVELTPAADRPYIGGSQNNDFLSLTFGYNGFGRLTGDESGSVGGNGGWGATGWSRLFGSDIGSQISWLLPTALVLLVGGLWTTRRARRTDPQRAALLLWGGWLLVTSAVFSFMAGIFHPYYTVALAPAIGAVVGIGGMLLWRQRTRHNQTSAAALTATAALAVAIVAGAIWSYVLLNRTPDYVPWLRYVVLLAGIAAAAVILLARAVPARVVSSAGAVGLIALLLGPTAYSLNTVNNPHTGAIPSAGPAAAFGPGGPGGFGGTRGGGLGGQTQGQGTTPTSPFGTAPNSPTSPFGGTAPTTPFGGGTFGGGRAGTGGGLGGLLNGSTVNSALTQLLQQNASKYTWAAATTGSNNAASYQLATGDPVMSIGGFNGTDPAPTLAQFEQYVQQGKIHYYVSGSTGANNSDSVAAQIANWVAANFTAQTVGGVTVYDLTTPTSTSSSTT